MSKRAILTEEQAIMSRQRRYMSEASILTAIDAARSKQKQLERMAVNFMEAHRKQDVNVLTPESSEYLVKQITKDGFETSDYRGISEALNGKAERMEERIKTFGHKLAAFRTEIFSFTTDRAVV